MSVSFLALAVGDSQARVPYKACMPPGISLTHPSNLSLEAVYNSLLVCDLHCILTCKIMYTMSLQLIRKDSFLFHTLTVVLFIPGVPLKPLYTETEHSYTCTTV